jgi:ubiquinone/menaquinone biosynthesis C-methylase UbiE
MADGRDEAVWTNHAEEQWQSHPTGHEYNLTEGNKPKLRLWLEELNPASVLDLGCGGALWRKMFAGYNYSGCDQNENMLRYAKKRFPDVEFHLSNGMELAFDDASFEMVFTSAVLQHNRHPDKEKVAREIFRILKPGGYYMCTENTFRHDNYQMTFRSGQWHEGLDDGYSFTSSGWEKFMKNIGFVMVRFDNPSEYIFQKPEEG